MTAALQQRIIHVTGADPPNFLFPVRICFGAGAISPVQAHSALLTYVSPVCALLVTVCCNADHVKCLPLGEMASLLVCDGGNSRVLELTLDGTQVQCPPLPFTASGFVLC